MSTTAIHAPIAAIRRRNRIASILRDVTKRHKGYSDRDRHEDGFWADPRNDWYWERVAEELAELIDRGKLA